MRLNRDNIDKIVPIEKYGVIMTYNQKGKWEPKRRMPEKIKCEIELYMHPAN